MLKKLDPDIRADNEPQQQRSRIVLIGRGIIQFVAMMAVLAGSVYAMNWLIATTPEKPKRPPFRTVYSIATQSITLSDHQPAIRVFGQATAERSVELKALVGGEIIAVNPAVRAGARIGKGDMLLEIDRFDYEVALSEARTNLAQTNAAVAEIEARLVTERDQLDIAREQLVLAEKDFERAKSLESSGSVTAKIVEDRMLIVIQRRQAVNQRENNILVAEAQKTQQIAALDRLDWKIRQAERKLDDTILYAPFDSVVRSTGAEVGKTVSTNEVLFSIYSADGLEARFTVTDAQYGRIGADAEPLIGRPVSAIWTTGGTDHVFAGKVVRIGSDIVSDRGGVEVFASLETPETGMRMRPGAFLEITVADRIYRDSAALPESAVYDSNTVYAVVDGKLEPRSVNILAYDGQNVIISGDVRDGDTIMTTRLSEIAPGLAVSVNTGN